MSAMARLQANDGESGSYLELVDDIRENGGRPAQDLRELFFRIGFNILISNVDDHLRNHGFLWSPRGWILSPLYDVNPTPVEFKARVLTTAIDENDRDCSLSTLISTCEYYGLTEGEAAKGLGKIARATAEWRAVAKSKKASRSEIALMESAFEHEDSRWAAL